MIDHIGVSVSDFDASKVFYRKALQPIGYELLLEFSAELTGTRAYAGFGVPPKPDFWIGSGQPNVPPIHVAFQVASRVQVDAFYRAALAAGGATTAHRVHGRSITPTTTVHSCWIRTATTSKRCATKHPHDFASVACGSALKRRCARQSSLAFQCIGDIHRR